MNRNSRYSLVLILLSAVCVTAQDVKPKVEIGRETTYVDGPLTKDGYVDYVAHLNQILSDGVTPENNGAVLLLKASPGEISSESYMKAYCKALGIEPQPLEGKEYFQNMGDYGKTLATKRSPTKNPSPKEIQDAVNELLKANETTGKPWKKKDNKLMADWIDANEEPIKLVEAASRRSKYYHPMISSLDGEEGMMISILLPQVQSSRAYARFLNARANMYAGEGEFDKCFEDLLTMRRLGNMISKGATLIEQLVGIAIVGIAQHSERELAFSGSLSEEQLAAYQKKMAKARVKTNMLRSFGECERLMYLDCVQHVMRGGVSALNELTGLAGGAKKTRMQQLLDQVVSNSTDWSFTMREGNRLYDKYMDMAKNKTWRDQQKVFKEMEKEITQIQEEVNSPTAMVRIVLGTPEFRGKMMGKIFVGLLLPALNAASTAEQRAQVMDDLSYASFSLARFKLKFERYPNSLDELESEIRVEVPDDRFSGQPLIYRRVKDGFLLYSVGANGKDDNGDGHYNEKYDKDDYGIGYHTFADDRENK